MAGLALELGDPLRPQRTKTGEHGTLYELKDAQTLAGPRAGNRHSVVGGAEGHRATGHQHLAHLCPLEPQLCP